METVRKLADRIFSLDEIEGITISGGEPFEQSDAVLELCREIRERSELSIVVFTGYTLRELEAHGSWISKDIDVLIAGRFQQQNRVARGLAGSSNKRFHFLSTRYSMHDFATVPEAEVVIDEAGDLVMSGIDPLRE